MPREHGESGEYVETVTLEDVLDTFDHVEGPVVLSADVADRLGCSRETARRKLETLHDRGDLRRRKVSRRVIYWRPENGQERREAAVDAADVQTPTATPNAESDTVAGALETVDFPSGRDPEACSAAVYAARDYLRDHGPATMREIVAEVMPEHPLGYDVDAALETVEAGDRFRGAWWRRVVKPGLKALPDVKAPARGASDWRHTGEA